MKKCLSILFVLCITLCFMLTGCASSSTLNLNDYLVVKIKGVDGYGEIEEYTLDYSAIAKKFGNRGEDYFVLGSAQDGTNKEENEGDTGFVFQDGEVSTRRYIYNDATNLEEAAAMMFESCLPRLIFEDTDKALSNGDEVEFSWEFDEEDLDALQKIFNVKIKFDDVTYKVKELTGLLKVDPFENVEFLFNGKNGTGTISNTAYAYISWDGDSMIKTIEAVLPENNGSLSNGDKVHVKITNFDETELAESHGICFTRTEADIALRGLNAYGQKGAKDGEKATINLKDFVSISALDGIETLVRPQVQIDYKRMLIQNLNSLSENVAEEDLLGYESSKLAALKILDRVPPYKLTSSSHKLSSVGSNYFDVYKEHGIKNGDVIKISFQIDEEKLAELQKVMNVEFKCEECSFTVEGLQEIKEFDPFVDYEVFYDGSNGSATAYGYIRFYPYPKNPDQQCTADFEVLTDKNGTLSNGDKIIISLKDFTEAENFIQNWGLIPTRTELEITVSGLQ